MAKAKKAVKADKKPIQAPIVFEDVKAALVQLEDRLIQSLLNDLYNKVNAESGTAVDFLQMVKTAWQVRALLEARK